MTFDDVYRRHLPAVLRAASRAVGRRDEGVDPPAGFDRHRLVEHLREVGRGPAAGGTLGHMRADPRRDRLVEHALFEREHNSGVRAAGPAKAQFVRHDGRFTCWRSSVNPY